MMHSQMYYADERSAREDMEAAAAERQMGSCSSFGRMISRVIMKCKGREGRTRSERMDYVRPAARTVTFTTAYAHAMAPQTHSAALPGAPFAAAAGKTRKKKKSKSKSKRVRFTQGGGPVPADAPTPHVAHQHQHYPSAAPSNAAPDSQRHHHHPPAAAEPYLPTTANGHGYSRYAPSPLAWWEMLGAAGTPRRHEYFSGEYRWCYPTPVRDGIYSIATDANRLTSIFSEENPNACAIV